MNEFNKKPARKQPENSGEEVRFTSGYSEERLSFAGPKGTDTPRSLQENRGENRPESPSVLPALPNDADNPDHPDDADRSPLPGRIRSMRSIAPDYARYPYSKNLHFYRQGKWMEDYEEESFEYHGRFLRYFPTYQTMNNDQLRGYFAWRTAVRRHLPALAAAAGPEGALSDADIRTAADSLPEVSALFDPDRNLSFLYLWIYELISGIGAADAEGFLYLRIADALAGRRDSRLHGHLRRWTADYVIYCGLDRSLALPYFHTDLDEALETAGRYEKRLAEDDDPGTSCGGEVFPDFSDVHPVFAALNTLSKTDLTRSPLYRQQAEDVERAAVHVYRTVCLFYRKNGKPMLLEQSFGGKGIYPYRMFDAAVFYDYRHYKDYTYEVDRSHVFHCTNGFWRCEKYLISDEKSRTIGMLFHETDRILRIRLGFGRPLKPQMHSSVMTSIVSDAVDEYLAQKREALRPKVHIDPARLASIRSDAAKTRDRLITEAETEWEPSPSVNRASAEAEKPQIEPQNEPSVPASESAENAESAERAGNAAAPEPRSGPLTDDQAAFLRLLLSGSSFQDFVSSRHLTLSIFIDEINEALYDEIGDTVIDTSGGGPELIEDYRPDLEAILLRQVLPAFPSDAR